LVFAPWLYSSMNVPGFLQVVAGVVLEPPDQRARGFLVQFGPTPRSSGHTHKVFGEMHMRI
jgi:hypothetical protein